MLLRFGVCILLLIAFVPKSATAAVVSPIAGEVRVSTGQGFQKIETPTDLAAGAQVLVSPDGSATIAYAKDCSVAAKPGRVVVIQSWSPCRALPEPMHFTPKVDEDTQQASSGPPPSSSSPKPPSTAKDDDDKSNAGTIWLIGGVAVGAGALAVILATQDNSISP